MFGRLLLILGMVWSPGLAASGQTGAEVAPEAQRPVMRPEMPPTARPDIPAVGDQPFVEKPGVEPDPPAWQALTESDASYLSCLFGLTMLGVRYTRLDPLTSPEDRDCGIARPLNVTALQPGVGIAGGATMRCATVRQLALWLRDEAVPVVRHLPGAPAITGIVPGSTYQCRARVGDGGEKLSEHALGNAFDIAALKLSDGSELTISPRNGSGDMREAVQKAMRHGACLYFTTVLGPGSDAAHDDHLHFDIAARRGGWRICD
ncbi:MAG TPA: extensin family protein [Paracoccus sp. (in: a-proteobacteria)]|uniref:extensin-like domain-containing protein n=1 Tax=uncultured Paracoccus sp. TaxID=189685 RepID=UPI00261CA1D8|nr:extensin family protein [uncultured Paracoccus sp.]HMQ39861.1 extensin family protein [Paracoccus sp. (in: a-proteobacteria)]HMR35738.1 extensin family protein [Paracoccus sp. (in: a-proteobacteria)]